VIKVNEGVGWPEGLSKFFAGHEFAGAAQQNCQNLKRLFLKLDLHAALAQFEFAQISLKGTEAEYLRVLCGGQDVLLRKFITAFWTKEKPAREGAGQD